MITFKEYLMLSEEFEGENIKAVWKNPSKVEMKKVPRWVRGIITKSGDIYLANTLQGEVSLHSELYINMRKTYDDGVKEEYDNYSKSLRVHRVSNTGVFAIGEVYRGQMVVLAIVKKWKPTMAKITKKLPHIKFLKKQIDNVDDYDSYFGASGEI